MVAQMILVHLVGVRIPAGERLTTKGFPIGKPFVVGSTPKRVDISERRRIEPRPSICNFQSFYNRKPFVVSVSFSYGSLRLFRCFSYISTFGLSAQTSRLLSPLTFQTPVSLRISSASSLFSVPLYFSYIPLPFDVSCSATRISACCSSSLVSALETHSRISDTDIVAPL